ncbi:MAG: hypothetical protein ACYS1A_07585 [Planctomycetota bacterium]|jgi:hypothetical protein
MDSDKHKAQRIGRREFLSRLSAAAAGSALMLGNIGRGEDISEANSSSVGPALPTIQLGEHRITRLIAGSNPILGYSYMGPVMDRHMKEYFTEGRTVEFLLKCERAGINTHQLGGPEKMADILRKLRERGSKMKFICLHASGPERISIKQVVEEIQPIAVVHHGGVTDRLFRAGKSGEVHDFMKRVHDAGVLAGVSAHNPDCIKQIADEGWGVDLFMTCFYYITRPGRKLEEMPPIVTAQVGRPFFASDPLEMTKVVRQVDQPCLGFKILAAGRMCKDEHSVAKAFKFAFKHIKPTDGVIVGMYPRYTDQIGQNAQNTRQFAVLRPE